MGADQKVRETEVRSRAWGGEVPKPRVLLAKTAASCQEELVLDVNHDTREQNEGTHPIYEKVKANRDKERKVILAVGIHAVHYLCFLEDSSFIMQSATSLSYAPHCREDIFLFLIPHLLWANNSLI